MRIPHEISENTLIAYETVNISERKEKIHADDFKWDFGFIETLRELALAVIAKNWKNCPYYSEIKIKADRSRLLELLPTDLPLELVVRIIDDEYYWKRCYLERWPNEKSVNRCYKIDKVIYLESPPESCSDDGYISGDLGDITDVDVEKVDIKDEPAKDKVIFTTKRIEKTWKQCYLEKHVAYELERMTPDIFNKDYIADLVNDFGAYIYCLSLKELQVSQKNEADEHISLFKLLSELPSLIEISICFNKRNLKEHFTWGSRLISDNDCILLGKGVEKSKLKILRVVRSDINCHRVKLIIRSLCNHCTLRVVDFSHCKIGDEGAHAIGALIVSNPRIDTLILVNNKIGVDGAHAIAYALIQNNNVMKLNLKLNPLQPEGGRKIMTALVRGVQKLRYLSLAACELSAENFYMGKIFLLNNTLQRLDLSNNNLGEEIGKDILLYMENNTSLYQLDLRMCNIPEEIITGIDLIINRNLRKFRGILKTPNYRENLI